MNDLVYKQLREISWQRKLTRAEEAELQKYLAAHPEAKTDWETESELNQLLQNLPEAPAVASNFTARVLQAVNAEATSATRKPAKRHFVWAWSKWLPRSAIACAVASLTLLGYHHHEQLKARAEMAHKVAALARAVSASPEVLQNYDHIRRLSDTPPTADAELLTLLQ
jgi:hypothetical protein